MKTGKRILSILLSVIMALGVCAAAPVTAGAEFDEVDGIKWSYEILEGSTGVRIIPGSEPADAAVSISGNIAIPSVLHLDDRDYIVIEIGDGAFNDVMFSGVTGITIPDTVKKIGVRAFQNMTNLTSVSFGEGSALTTIGVNAFYGCKNLSSIDIPQGVTTIGNYAFQDCQNLESVVIPDNVTTLGTYAFRNCTNLQSAVIGANVPSLNGTFASCGNLESVTFSSNSVTDFSGYTFYGCSELTSITIPCNFDKAKFT
ncbi:MAG: leucine-rich repeat domain-containing protein, partial [Clostridia bacterium]|nr:leucine-rich repeat domain-containing protein [Clostridia bacterium]